MSEDPQSLETRRRVYDALAASPGLSARGVQAAAGTAWGETTYHLLRLEEAGHVRRERGTELEFYFATAARVPPRGLAGLSGSTTARKVLVALLEEPELPSAALCVRTRTPRPVLSLILRRLIVGGIVSRRQRSAVPTFVLRDRALVGEILARPSTGPVDRAVDRTILLWGSLLPE